MLKLLRAVWRFFTACPYGTTDCRPMKPCERCLEEGRTW